MPTYRAGKIPAEPLAFLAADQDELFAILDRIDESLRSILGRGFSADAFVGIAGSIRKLSDTLGLHDRREELHLFPRIDGHVPGHCGSHRIDHRQLRGLIERLRKTVLDVESSKLHGTSVREMTSCAGEISDRLRAHIRREREELYPFAKTLLSGAELTACDIAMADESQGDR
ncbi:MAG TPA: hemerythrin domain-containing protein [Bacteroidota bacterium]|nr:hemerythrin domain-containing protein [Bacteroidota bacterium]